MGEEKLDADPLQSARYLRGVRCRLGLRRGLAMSRGDEEAGAVGVEATAHALLRHDHTQGGQDRAGGLLRHQCGGLDHIGGIIRDREPRLAPGQARNPPMLAAIQLQ